MSSSPKYTALSYAWGERKASRAILCEDQCIRITLNLYRALAHLRHPSDPVDLWADAVCLNQKDDIEKTRQVRSMRTIFMGAKNVIVWLGPDPRQVAKGVFQTLSAMATRDFEDPLPLEDIFWRDAERLFTKHWFRRLWCLQEIVLVTEAEVLWGAEAMSWRILGKTATWI
ncbi:hypothetical protein JX266_002281 [Neoarthrinium moseri]|nr:hypothetical protein JX266_002281 [Neoarthrinium moseri]